MESSVITPQDVLETMMNDGTIDAIRLKIIMKLKADEELKKTTFTMLEQSKVLNTPGSEKQTKRELFDALRQELEAPALEEASKSVWELILDDDRFGKEISETVERVYCRLSGCEPPLFPPSNNESQPENEKEKEKEKENENLDSSSKKRTFSEMSPQGGAGEVADGSSDPPSIPGDSVLDCRGVPCDDGNSLEPEPGRCRRTDGKNWRCSKFVVPDHRYCERHLNRGRLRSRKQVETTSQVATLSPDNINDLKTNLPISLPVQVMTNNDDKNTNSNKSGNVSPRLSSSPQSAPQDGTCKAESSL